MSVAQHNGNRFICQLPDNIPDVANSKSGIKQQIPVLSLDQIAHDALCMIKLMDRIEPFHMVNAIPGVG